jgi:hypothetical protein
MVELTPERARIFRITHIENVPWILANGLHCKNSSVQDANFIQIGNPDLIDKRAHRSVPIHPGGTLNDYIAFYFTPFSPMLLNIKTGWGVQRRPMREIVVLTSTLHDLSAKAVPFVFTDRHAYLKLAQFSSETTELADRVDWQLLGARDFARDPNDLGKVERYQAEALAFEHVPLNALNGIICHGSEQESRLQALVSDAGLALPVASRPGWFF